MPWGEWEVGSCGVTWRVSVGEGACGVGLRLISLRVAWRILFHKPCLLASFPLDVGLEVLLRTGVSVWKVFGL